jgi:D-aminopeptidase
MPTGPHNAITDVPGSVWATPRYGRAASNRVARCCGTGVTAIWPRERNPFFDRVYAAVSPFNGYGVLTGDLVVAEWGLLGSPIVLWDTANLLTVVDATIRHVTASDPAVGVDDVCIPVVGECDDG